MAGESYLTARNRQVKAEQYLKMIHGNGRSRGPQFDLNEAGLLLLDLQKYFLDPGSHAYLPAARAILEPVRRLIRLFREADRPVVFTRHVDDPLAVRPMTTWWRDQIFDEDALSDLVAECGADPGEILRKSCYDAFHGTSLTSRLVTGGVRQLVVCGVLTHLCVETTARAAFCHGFHVFLPVDATAASSEAHHTASLLNLSHGFARITTTDELAGQR